MGAGWQYGLKTLVDLLPADFFGDRDELRYARSGELIPAIVGAEDREEPLVSDCLPEAV